MGAAIADGCVLIVAPICAAFCRSAVADVCSEPVVLGGSNGANEAELGLGLGLGQGLVFWFSM